jgi:hypothetical protein
MGYNVYINDVRNDYNGNQNIISTPLFELAHNNL